MRPAVLAACLLAPAYVLGSAERAPAGEKEPVLAGKTVSEWIKALEDKNQLVKQQAAAILGNAKGSAARPAALALARALKDPSIRMVALTSLGRIGPDAKHAVPALIDGLADPDYGFRGSIAFTLGQIRSPEAVPPLVEIVKDVKHGSRVLAITALGNMGPQAKTAIPALTDTLADPNLRYAAVLSLIRIGTDAVPALSKALENADAALVDYAITHIGNTKRKEATPVLTAALKHKDAKIQLSAAAALVQVGDRSEACLSLVCQALSHKDLSLRNRAHMALAVAGSDAMPFLTRRLEDKEAAVRSQAAQGLGALGNRAAAAVPALARAVKDADADVRDQAVAALGRLGQDAGPTLVEELKVPGHDAAFRVKIIIALSSGGGARQAIPVLTDHLKDKSSLVQIHASLALMSAGARKVEEHVDLLAALLNSKEFEIRNKAFSDLSAYYQPTVKIAAYIKASEVIQQLVKGEDLDMGLRAADVIVARSFATPPPNLPDILATLTKGLGNAELRRRQLAMQALVRLGKRAAPASTALIAAMKDDAGDVRQSAIYTLGLIGPAAKSAVPELLKAIDDKTEETRLYAVQALSGIGPDAADAVPALSLLLKHADENVRLSAIEALGNMGPAAKGAVPALAEIMKQESTAKGGFPPYVPQSFARPPPRRFTPGNGPRMAAEAVFNIGLNAPEVAPAFLAMLQGNNPVDRRIAATALEKLGEPVLDDLARLVKGQDAELRGLAVQAIGGIALKTRKAIPVLGAALEDSDTNVSQQAALALGRVGPAAVQALPQLRKVLTSDRDPDVRAFTAQALGDLGVSAAPAIADLVKSLDDKEAYVRQWSAYALGAIGPEARSAVPRLMELMQDSDAFVRRFATRALSRIRGEKS